MSTVFGVTTTTIYASRFNALFYNVIIYAKRSIDPQELTRREALLLFDCQQIHDLSIFKSIRVSFLSASQSRSLTVPCPYDSAPWIET